MSAQGPLLARLRGPLAPSGDRTLACALRLVFFQNTFSLAGPDVAVEHRIGVGGEVLGLEVLARLQVRVLLLDLIGRGLDGLALVLDRLVGGGTVSASARR